MKALVLIIFSEMIYMAKITIIGGDNRLAQLKKKLESLGYNVDTIGQSEDDNGDIKTSNVVVLPVPTTKDKVNVFSPYTKRLISLEEIKQELSSNQLILCCNYSFDKLNFVDYGKMDDYAILNAIPTAEGAIKIAMENTPYTVWDSNVLVIGYGRVSKVLADRLKGLGANVTVSARKTADFALLKSLGFRYINTNELNSLNIKYDVIFNTVDACVIEDEVFKNHPCDLIIDLSTFGGFSMEACKQNKITAIKAPGLPNKTAPLTSGEILCDTVIPIINSYFKR